MLRKWFTAIRKGAAKVLSVIGKGLMVPASHRDALFLDEYRHLEHRNHLEDARTRARSLGHRL